MAGHVARHCLTGGPSVPRGEPEGRARADVRARPFRVPWRTARGGTGRRTPWEGEGATAAARWGGQAADGPPGRHGPEPPPSDRHRGERPGERPGGRRAGGRRPWQKRRRGPPRARNPVRRCGRALPRGRHPVLGAGALAVVRSRPPRERLLPASPPPRAALRAAASGRTPRGLARRKVVRAFVCGPSRVTKS
ncbi:hypothetical protein GCM10010227_24070 [Streptomyces gougerotii]|uniref:Uncharacterized protein n=1 Tax=Streptomyces gougerotii TaxID=53448 RepID=A0A8H9HIX4_9ACTN|nr:hypothetical protein GCM10010227_24070 [Streptomyces gougerotii]